MSWQLRMYRRWLRFRRSLEGQLAAAGFWMSLTIPIGWICTYGWPTP